MFCCGCFCLCYTCQEDPYDPIYSYGKASLILAGSKYVYCVATIMLEMEQ